MEFLPTQLLTKSGLQDTSAVLSGKKAVALYFSAHWCPPCRSFTPVAGDFYKALSALDPSALEVIFVSSDEDAEAFDHYYGEQPWTAIPFTDPVREALGSKFGVRGIPSFIVLNPATGEIVDREGRGTVTANKDSPVGALAKWVK